MNLLEWMQPVQRTTADGLLASRGVERFRGTLLGPPLWLSDGSGSRRGRVNGSGVGGCHPRIENFPPLVGELVLGYSRSAHKPSIDQRRDNGGRVSVRADMASDVLKRHR